MAAPKKGLLDLLGTEGARSFGGPQGAGGTGAMPRGMLQETINPMPSEIMSQQGLTTGLGNEVLGFRTGRGMIPGGGFEPQKVFPAPEKISGVPGGQYLDATTKEPMSGAFGQASVNVQSGKPEFLVQQPLSSNVLDIQDAGNKVRTNLFRKSAGWEWEGQPPAQTDTLVSVETRIPGEKSDKHFYALSADYSGLDLTRYPNAPSEPRLRPTTRGDVTVGNQVGTIKVRGKLHPVYDTVTVGPRTTGNMDIQADKPITFRGKDVQDWTPDDWQAYGDQYGAKNIGPLTQPVQYRYADGEQFEIPGGLDGNFTYYDMLYIKNQGIDPSRIPEKLHSEIQKKIVRSVMPENITNEQLFNQMVFGLTSPNNPLFPNELAVSRVRVRSQSDIDRIAKMINWEPGANVSKEKRNAANAKIAKFFGVQASGKGGLGVRGSADYTNIAELAKLFQKNPTWFKKKGTEGWDDYVERLMSQVRGLSAKTASFAGVWQDPVNAAISAVDRHMAKIFKDNIFKDDNARIAWENKTVKSWNKKIDKRIDLDAKRNRNEITDEDFEDETRNLFGANNQKVETLKQLMDQPAGEGHFVDMILAEVSKPKNMAMMNKDRKTKEMVESLKVPERLRSSEFIIPPEKISLIGDVYRKALSENHKAAQEQNLGLFASQWMLWDRQRRRMEPHEIMHPELNKLPPMSLEQARAAKDAHRKLGFTNYQKSPDTQQLMPTKSGPQLGVSPSQLATFGLIPPIVAPLLYDQETATQ